MQRNALISTNMLPQVTKEHWGGASKKSWGWEEEKERGKEERQRERDEREREREGELLREGDKGEDGGKQIHPG